MRRQLKQLKGILEHQLQPYSCLVDIQERGPILSIVLRHMPGAVPDGPNVQSIVRSGLDAVFAPDIQKVNDQLLKMPEISTKNTNFHTTVIYLSNTISHLI